MKEIGQNIWVHDDAMSLAGKQLGLRMTIVKLSNGGLWVHSPTALSPELLEKVEELAHEKGCCKITLEVIEGNEVAKSAYLKFGFAEYELDPALGHALFWQKRI